MLKPGSKAIFISKSTIGISISAILYAFCFPFAYHSTPINSEMFSLLLIWIALVPLFYFVDFEKPIRSFRQGYLFGIISNSIILYWINIAMKKYGGLATWHSLLILTSMTMFVAIYPAVALFLTAKYSRSPKWRIIMAACIWSLLDWSKNYAPFEGFPWALPAYALHGGLYLIQTVDIFGTQGLSLLILVANFLIAESLRHPKKLKAFEKYWIGLSTALLLCLIYGGLRFRNIEDTVRNIEPIRASLIQGNISQDQKWERQARKNILETYALLSSESMLNKNIDLVIWPEAAIPYLTPRRSLQTSFPVDFLKGQSYLIYGAATYATQGRKRNYYNSAFFSAPNGEHLGAYDKKRLVPFGEYVPFEKWIKGIVPAMAGNFSRGDKTFVFHHDKFHFSVIICYEVLFPELSIDMVNNGAEFFVNITNDAWFDVTSGPFQHAHIGRFRAIETRRSFLRAANTGITYWITPSGQIFDATRLFKSTTVIAKIYPSQEKTFYVHFPWLVPFLMLVIVIYGIFKNRQHG